MSINDPRSFFYGGIILHYTGYNFYRAGHISHDDIIARESFDNGAYY